MFFFVLGAMGAFPRRFPFVPVLVRVDNDPARVFNFFGDRPPARTDPEGVTIFESINALRHGDNPIKHVSNLKRHAAGGDGDACFTMGVINEFGLFKHRMNDTAALEFYQIGAENGHAECMTGVAFFHRISAGNNETAYAYALSLEKKAARDSVRARLHLALAHRFGIHEQESCDRVGELIWPLATALNRNLTFRSDGDHHGVRRMDINGLPQARDLDMMLEMQITESTKGSGSAHYRNAQHLLSRADPDLDTVIWHLKEAVAQRNTPAALVLGMMEVEGDGIERNKESGMAHLKLAADTGTGAAMVWLAKIADAVNKREVYEKACAKGVDHGCYEIAAGFVDGIRPFKKNPMAGVPYLKRVSGSSRGVFLRARLIRDTIMPGTCEDSQGLLLLFLELSALFTDSRLAWESVAYGDREYGLRIYAWLAEMGSEAAAWNAERLALTRGENASHWFDLQLAMKFEEAQLRMYDILTEQGDTEEANEYLRKAHRVPRASFILIWNDRWKSVPDTMKALNDIKGMTQGAFIPVALARVYMFIEGISDAVHKRDSNKAIYVTDTLKAHGNDLIVVVLILVLYILIGIRVRRTG